MVEILVPPADDSLHMDPDALLLALLRTEATRSASL
jgi:hypothetical protein